MEYSFLFIPKNNKKAEEEENISKSANRGGHFGKRKLVNDLNGY